MDVRLGYVAISLSKDLKAQFRSVTLSTLNSLDSKQRIEKLKELFKTNLNTLYRILEYNKNNNIYLYRITSKLLPFASHSIIDNWDYIKDLNEELLKIGQFIKENNLRVSMHPDHYTILNTPNDGILNNSLKDLDYHNKIFNGMNLDSNYKLVMHIGGAYNNKDEAIIRFIKEFKKLPKTIRSRIVLENDDKTYTAHDVLSICKIIKVPMVLDVHHDKCNPSQVGLDLLVGDIFDTWNNETFKPKIHFSSSKSIKEFRSHADNIVAKDFKKFINLAKNFNRDFDCMIEAKNKDYAVFKLAEDLKKDRKIKVINQGLIRIN